MRKTRRAVLGGMSLLAAGSVAGCVGGDDGGGEPVEADFDADNSDVDPDDISVPTFTLSMSHNQNEGTVVVSHSGGRSVSVDNLYIRGEGIGADYDEVSFINLPDSEFSSGDNFGSGDSVTVELEDNEAFRVEVVWVDSETNYPKTIEQLAVGMDEA